MGQGRIHINQAGKEKVKEEIAENSQMSDKTYIMESIIFLLITFINKYLNLYFT